jgi:chromosome segregation ATPase
LLEDKRVLEKNLAALKHELDSAQTQYVLSRQQLNEKQDRIQEVRLMQQQSQKNLENFQSTIQEQRQAEQQQFAAQKQEAQAEIAKLREQLEELRSATATMQSQYHRMESKHEQLKVESASAIKTLRAREKELNESEKARVTQTHAAKHWQTQYKDANQAINEKNNLYYQSQAEIKSVRDQLTSLQDRVEELHEQNKLLNLEKIELIRQKQELEKMLKR